MKDSHIAIFLRQKSDIQLNRIIKFKRFDKVGNV